MCATLFHYVEQMYKGGQHLALIMLVEYEIKQVFFFAAELAVSQAI